MVVGTSGDPNTKASIMGLRRRKVEEYHCRGRDDHNWLVHLGVSTILSISIMALFNEESIVQTAMINSAGQDPILSWQSTKKETLRPATSPASRFSAKATKCSAWSFVLFETYKIHDSL